MTADALKDCNKRDLARLAKERGIVGWHAMRKDQLIRALAPDHTDRQLAEQLNTEGWRSGRGGSFTANKVQWVRYVHGIRSGCPEGPAACAHGERGDGRCSAQVAAKALNVDVSTIAAWCKSGCLDGIQVTAHGPWWIRLTPEDITRLRKPIRRRWKKRSSK